MEHLVLEEVHTTMYILLPASIVLVLLFFELIKGEKCNTCTFCEEVEDNLYCSKKHIFVSDKNTCVRWRQK